MKTASERVLKGILWLNKSDKTPKGWRNKLKPYLGKMGFYNPDKGPLGILFGDYSTGIKTLRIILGGNSFGFCSDYMTQYDSRDLNIAWEHALKTWDKWQPNEKGFIRKILGVTYYIYEREPDKWGIICSIGTFPRSYSSYTSAMRCVRKHSKTI